MRHTSNGRNPAVPFPQVLDPTNKRFAFYASVFSLVAQIPHGRVTTYGTIAHTLGRPTGARSVGWALSVAPREADLPCHRVVNHQGYLSGGWHWGHPDIMAGLLRDEGVPFLEPHRVDLRACLWIPDDLLQSHQRIPHATMSVAPISLAPLSF